MVTQNMFDVLVSLALPGMSGIKNFELYSVGEKGEYKRLALPTDTMIHGKFTKGLTEIRNAKDS